MYNYDEYDDDEQHKNSQKKGQKPGNLADGGDPGGQPVTEKPDFLTFFEFFSCQRVLQKNFQR
jgi:hypothetical protein